MLLVTDMRIDGLAREKMIVSYYRYRYILFCCCFASYSDYFIRMFVHLIYKRQMLDHDRRLYPHSFVFPWAFESSPLQFLALV